MHIEALSALRRVADDLTALGNYAMGALVEKATDRFSGWEFDA